MSIADLPPGTSVEFSEVAKLRGLMLRASSEVDDSLLRFGTATTRLNSVAELASDNGTSSLAAREEFVRSKSLRRDVVVKLRTARAAHSSLKAPIITASIRKRSAATQLRHGKNVDNDELSDIELARVVFSFYRDRKPTFARSHGAVRAILCSSPSSSTPGIDFGYGYHLPRFPAKKPLGLFPPREWFRRTQSDRDSLPCLPDFPFD